MPTPVRKRAIVRSRAPVRITRVGSPSLPAKPTAPAKRSKVFSHLADALAQIAGLIKGVREREREGKIAAGTANKLAGQLANFMETAEELSAAEAKSRLGAIQEEATKVAKAPVRHQPGSEVLAMTANQAHGLRAALGLPNHPHLSEKTARDVTAHRKAAAKAESAQQGHEGRAVDIPYAAQPVFMDRPNPQTVEYTTGGTRLPGPLVNESAVYMSVVELFLAADSRPIVLSLSELSTMTGLNTDVVNQAIVALEKRKLLTRQPNRAGSVPMWAPAAIM